MINEKAVNSIKTPSYVIDGDKLKENLEKLKAVSETSGAKILLAQKAFSAFYFYKEIGKYLSGTTASSLFEARLGNEEMGGETHIFTPAYKEDEFDEILSYCSHIVFNSHNQFSKFFPSCRKNNVSVGVRVNPLYSEIKSDIYNPCVSGSRLGTVPDEFNRHSWDGIEGIHFHTLCEQNSDALERTIPHLEKHFSEWLKRVKWLNLGGGHHITRDDYNTKTLVQVIKYLKDKYKFEVYLEPGEAIALNAGYLVTEIIDIVENGMKILVLDTSAACHMPDVIEMPYRPPLYESENAGVLPHTYRLAGPTCLAGDVIGDYSFKEAKNIGDRLVFCDMAIYTMVKNNTFNGIALPDIAVYSKSDGLKVIKSFGYDDFKCRLS